MTTTTDRRSFLRLLGGGVVLTGAGALGGCVSDVPPEAVAAWRNAGNETDPRRWVLAHAILVKNTL